MLLVSRVGLVGGVGQVGHRLTQPTHQTHAIPPGIDEPVRHYSDGFIEIG